MILRASLDWRTSVHVLSIPMTRIAYPTPDQIHLAVRWSNHGVSALDPRNGTEHGSLKNRARTGNLVRLRDLIFRLQLPWQYETMRAEILHRPASAVDERLLSQILATLRVSGYIHPAGPVPGGSTRPVYAPTPLSAHQLHVVRLIASGLTPAEIAALFEQNVSRVNTVLRRARTDHGLASPAHLVAHAYASGWLPTFAEYGKLMRAPIKPEGQPFRRVSGWVNVA